MFLPGGSSGDFISLFIWLSAEFIPLGCKTKIPCFWSAESSSWLLEATTWPGTQTPFCSFTTGSGGGQVPFVLQISPPSSITSLSPAGNSSLLLRIYGIKLYPRIVQASLSISSCITLITLQRLLSHPHRVIYITQGLRCEIFRGNLYFANYSEIKGWT